MCLGQEQYLQLEARELGPKFNIYLTRMQVCHLTTTRNAHVFHLVTTDNVARLKHTLWTLTLKFCGSELTIAFLRIDSAVGSAGISITITNSTLIFFCIGIQNKIATEFL